MSSYQPVRAVPETLEDMRYWAQGEYDQISTAIESIDSQLSSVGSGLIFQGIFDPTSDAGGTPNTIGNPQLRNATPNGLLPGGSLANYYWIVDVSGTYNFEVGDNTTATQVALAQNDWVVLDGAGVWTVVAQPSISVQSFNTRTGAVTTASPDGDGDYNTTQVTEQAPNLYMLQAEKDKIALINPPSTNYPGPAADYDWTGNHSWNNGIANTPATHKPLVTKQVIDPNVIGELGIFRAETNNGYTTVIRDLIRVKTNPLDFQGAAYAFQIGDNRVPLTLESTNILGVGLDTDLTFNDEKVGIRFRDDLIPGNIVLPNEPINAVVRYDAYDAADINNPPNIANLKIATMTWHGEQAGGTEFSFQFIIGTEDPYAVGTNDGSDPRIAIRSGAPSAANGGLGAWNGDWLRVPVVDMSAVEDIAPITDRQDYSIFFDTDVAPNYPDGGRLIMKQGIAPVLADLTDFDTLVYHDGNWFNTDRKKTPIWDAEDKVPPLPENGETGIIEGGWLGDGTHDGLYVYWEGHTSGERWMKVTWVDATDQPGAWTAVPVTSDFTINNTSGFPYNAYVFTGNAFAQRGTTAGTWVDGDRFAVQNNSSTSDVQILSTAFNGINQIVAPGETWVFTVVSGGWVSTLQ